MAKQEKAWAGIVIPYEMYKMGTKGGALIFRINDGDYRGYEFVRPAVLVRKSFEEGSRGFELSYSIVQTIDNGDVIAEEPESIILKKSEKQANGSYKNIDEIEILIPDLQEII